MEIATSKDIKNMRQAAERANGEHLDRDYVPPIDLQESHKRVMAAMDNAIREAIKRIIKNKRIVRTLRELQQGKQVSVLSIFNNDEPKNWQNEDLFEGID